MNNMQPVWTTIEEARRWASLFLTEHHREPRVADLLLEHVLGLSFAQLLAAEREEFPEEHREKFVEDLYAHAETGIPVQHLIGQAHFYGREFLVNQHVLIPRPETEELVVGVLDFLKEKGMQNPVVADVGTGSGVIAITLACEHPSSRMLATDLSAKALEAAAENARLYEAEIDFYQGNFLEPLQDKHLDCIVSNPPYIARSEAAIMDDTVKNFDPELALFAEEEGLAAYREIVKQIKTFQLRPGLIAFEIGHLQGEAVKQILTRQLPDYKVAIKKDMNQKDRMIFAVKDS